MQNLPAAAEPFHHGTPLKPMRFSTSYEGVSEACTRLGITTIIEMWHRYRAAANKLLQDKVISRDEMEKLAPENGYGSFHVFINGTRGNHAKNGNPSMNPWDEGRGAYTLRAMITSMALETHPRHLFGSPEQLIARQIRVHARPTPQRVHIYKLMRKAANPLTGRRGLRNTDICELASTRQLMDRAQLVYRFDSPFAPHKTPALDPSTGQTQEWAEDFAAILDKTVEETFPHEARHLNELSLDPEWAKAETLTDGNYVYMRRRAPLYRPAPLEAALHVPETPSEESRIDDWTHDFLKDALSRALGTLPARTERMLRLHYGINCTRMSQSQIADLYDLSASAVGQICRKGLELLNAYNKKMESEPEDEKTGNRPPPNKAATDTPLTKEIVNPPEPLLAELPEDSAAKTQEILAKGQAIAARIEALSAMEDRNEAAERFKQSRLESLQHELAVLERELAILERAPFFYEKSFHPEAPDADKAPPVKAIPLIKPVKPQTRGPALRPFMRELR